MKPTSHNGAYSHRIGTCSTVLVLVLILLVQGAGAGYISAARSGEPLVFSSGEESDINDTQSLNETVTAQLAALPLSFIPNEGQTDPKVRFMVKGSGTSFSFTNTSTLFSMQASHDTPKETVIITQTFIGANESARIAGEEKLPGVANFFIGDNAETWRSNISTYGVVRYHDLYPGIDLLYKGNGTVLKREFIIAPGADPALIRMGYTGADSLSIDSSGGLNITAGPGTMTESPPVCFQEINGIRTDVGARYVLTGGNELIIAVDTYNSAYELVIDPDLVYSSYLGGTDDDRGYGIAADATGYAYVTGQAVSTNFPTTTGAYKRTNEVFSDAFVTKLNGAGSGLVYSTYLGGKNGNDFGSGIAVDATGYVYLTGQAGSEDFPTTAGAYQTTIQGSGFHAFVTKLNSAGSSLVYSTYLAGTDVDSGNGIAVDASGNAYVTGDTKSINFPTTAGAFQTTCGGGSDAFITKLNGAGSGLVYSTYLGGQSYDYGRGIAVDASGNAYVTGEAGSANFPMTAGAFQTTFGGGSDAFITKLNGAGSGLVYSTCLGGQSYDEGRGITVDASGNVYVTGEAGSANFPTTAGAFQITYGGGSDAFITKLNGAGSGLVYSTYLGGTGADRGYGIGVDGSGIAFVTGETVSANFPTTAGAYQTTFGGGWSNAFVTKLNAAGSTLVYSTYLGGQSYDYGRGIAVDGSGNAYITGYSTDFFPMTTGAFQTTFGGYYDAFVAKFSFSNSPPVISTITPSTGVNYGSLGITITGKNFVTGTNKVTLTRSGQKNITATGVTRVSGTKITCKLPLLGKTAGDWNVFLTTGGQTVRWSNKFRIIAEKYSYVKKWGTKGTGDKQVDTPGGIAVDKKGNIYVADTNNNRIIKFNGAGKYLAKWGKKGKGKVQFSSPRDVAVDKSGYIYIADTGNNRIQKLKENGNYVGQWNGISSPLGTFKAPGGIAVDNRGNVYVADTNHHVILRFNTNGRYLGKWGKKGNGKGQFSSPRDVEVDPSGNIYVADTGNNRIQRLDSNFKNITVWGSKGSGSGKFNTPTGIAADSSQNVYVTDTNNNRIQKFSTDGVFITKWGSKGSGNSNFKTPESLVVNSAGRVYIADTGNNRISVFKSNAPLSLMSSEGTLMKEQNFTSPVNVAIPVVNHPVAAAPVVRMPVKSSPVLSPAIGPVTPGLNPMASRSGERIVEQSIL